MRDYELVLIFDAEEKAEEIKKVLAKIKGWLKGKGKVISEEKWGGKTLAYPLKTSTGKKLREGEYFQVNFEAEADFVFEIGKKLKLEEKVVRYLFVKKSEEKGGEKASGKKS